MIKSKIRKRTYRAIYRLLDRVSPVPFDCGTICGAVCCNAAKYDDSLGMMLLPGEDKVHDRKDDWLSWETLISNEYEFPESWKGKIWFVRCKTPPKCTRHLRPMQCRTFPLLPHLDEDGSLHMIFNDFELPYICPMIEDETELDERFVKATTTAWRHLLRDPLIYDLVWKESRDRDKVGTDTCRAWCAGDPILEAYHDCEWCKINRDDRFQFEMLCLEGASVGLAWKTIMHKREAYRAAFHNFDIDICAAMTNQELEDLLLDKGLIRNRSKIFSVRKNAQAVQRIREEYGSFDAYLWSFTNGKQIDGRWKTLDEVPTESEVSRAMAKDMKKRGIAFVGPVITYSFLQAVGIVNDHLEGCEYRYDDI